MTRPSLASAGVQHGHHDDGVAIGVRAALAAYTLWGLLTIYWRELHGFDAFELIGWRIALASVVMALVVTVRRRWPVLRAAATDRRLVTRLTIAALLLAVNWTAYVWAVTHDRVIETALGYFMAPLGTMLLGVVVLRERPSAAQRAAIGLAVVAVVVLTGSYGRPPWIALALATTWSVYGLLKRQVPLSPVESLAGETFVLTVPAVVLAAALAGRDDSIPAAADAGQWVLVSFTGLVTAVPLVLFAVAARRLPFTLLGPLQYLIPTINFVLGWLAFAEPMPAVRLVGFAFVWAALLLVTVDRLRLAPRAAAVVPAEV